MSSVNNMYVPFVDSEFLDRRVVDFAKDTVDVITEFPFRVIGAEPVDVTDPPDVVANSVLLDIASLHWSAGQPLTFRDGFEDRTIGVPGTPDVIDCRNFWRSENLPEGIHQIKGVDVVANLLAFIAKNIVWLVCYGAFDKIRKKAVKCRAGMTRAGQAATAEAGCFQAEITPVFLNQ